MQQPPNTYIGQKLGNYRIIRRLGAGGFATVYLGNHVQTNWEAAVKILNVNYPEETFRQEANILWNLRHPHIIGVKEFTVENGIYCLIMEYASKGSLRQIHPQGNILPQSRILDYVRQIASALDHIHKQQLIHCDIKPSNFLIRDNGEILLSDFGIATEVVTMSLRHMGLPASPTSVFGTPQYITPEQLLGQKPTHATDQYALGIVVYEWLCGTPPFTGPDPYLICQAHIHASPPRLNDPTIPTQLESTVRRALAKDPKDRFPSILAFAQTLEAAILNPQSVLPLSRPHQNQTKVRSMWEGLPPPRPTSITLPPPGEDPNAITQGNPFLPPGTTISARPGTTPKKPKTRRFDWDNLLEEPEDRRFVFFGLFIDLLCLIPLPLWLQNPNWTIGLPALNLPNGVTLPGLPISSSLPNFATNPSYLDGIIALLVLVILCRILCAAASKRGTALPLAWVLIAYETFAIFGLVVYLNNAFSKPLYVLIPIVAIFSWLLNAFLYARKK